MKIVLKANFEGGLNGKELKFEAKDVVDLDAVYVDYLVEAGAKFEILEAKPNEVTVEAIEELEDSIQTEDEALEADAIRAIVEDEQTEAEALEAEEFRSEMEDVEEDKPSKSKRNRK